MIRTMTTFYRLVRKLRRVPVVPAVVLFFSAIATLMPYVLMPHSPFDIALSEQLVPPFW